MTQLEYESLPGRPASGRGAASGLAPARPPAVALLAIVGAALAVVAAGWVWEQATPALGERPFVAARTWAARLGALAAALAAQSVLLGVALPQLYRRRPVYLGLAGACGLGSVLAAIAAAALLAAATATATSR